MSNYRAIHRIRRDHERSGGHFFDADTMEFFNSRVEPYSVSNSNDDHNRRFFITSERFTDDEETAREFSVRYASTDPATNVTTIETFGNVGDYPTEHDAIMAIVTLFDSALDVGWETIVDTESLR